MAAGAESHGPTMSGERHRQLPPAVQSAVRLLPQRAHRDHQLPLRTGAVTQVFGIPGHRSPQSCSLRGRMDPMADSPSEVARLVERAVDGDQQLWGQLLERYRARLRKMAVLR